MKVSKELMEARRRRRKRSEGGFVGILLAMGLFAMTLAIPYLIQTGNTIRQQTNYIHTREFKQRCYRAEKRMAQWYVDNSTAASNNMVSVTPGSGPEGVHSSKMMIPPKGDGHGGVPSFLKPVIGHDDWGNKVSYQSWDLRTDTPPKPGVVARFVSPGANGVVDTSSTDAQCQKDDICYYVTSDQLYQDYQYERTASASSSSGASSGGGSGTGGGGTSGGSGADTVPPTTPPNLKAVALSVSQVKLTWDPSKDNVGVAGYYIYDGSGKKLATSKNTYYTFSGLSPNTKYCYKVAAYDKAGNTSAMSGEVCTVTSDTVPPTTPSNLKAVATSPSSIKLAWSLSTDNVKVAGYSIYNTAGKKLANSGSTSYTFSGLSAGTKYCYELRAYDEAGNLSAYSNIACATTPTLGGQRKWRIFLSSKKIVSSPAIGPYGAIYIGADDGRIYAVYSNGRRKWAKYIGGTTERIESSPAIDRYGTIYIGTGDGYLYALTLSGRIKWKFYTGGNIISSPAISSDGTIYVGSWGKYNSSDYYSGYLYAISSSGRLKWKYKTGRINYSSPAIDLYDGTVYVVSGDYLYAISSSGKLKWKRYIGFSDSSPSVGLDRTIYVGSRNSGCVYAFRPTGSQRWRHCFWGYAYVDCSPVIGADGTVYVILSNNGDDLVALNGSNGSTKWSTNLGSPGSMSSPVVGADGLVYVADGIKLFAVDAKTGKVKWKYSLGRFVDSSPVIASDGTLYVATEDGDLYAIKTTSRGLAHSVWPKFHANAKNVGRR